MYPKCRIETHKIQMSLGSEHVDFLGRTIPPAGVAPQADKVKNFLSKQRFPKLKEALRRFIVFLRFSNSSKKPPNSTYPRIW